MKEGRVLIRHTTTLALLGMVLAACSGGGTQTGAGGSNGSGGSGTGGTASGKGGAASGGVSGTGGSSSGGVSGFGGQMGGSSGATGRGGSSGSGGVTGSGGAGGQSSNGTGGSGPAGSGGTAGSSAAGGLVNTYDGARATTVSFDTAWKFHLGDVTGAQATTFDDSSWTGLDVPHDWSISLPFTQNSPAGAGGGYLNGGVGLVSKDVHAARLELGAEDPRPVRRRLHGQHRLPERDPGRRPSLRVLVLRVRPDGQRQARRARTCSPSGSTTSSRAAAGTRGAASIGTPG